MEINRNIFAELTHKKANLRQEVTEITDITLPTKDEIQLARELDERFSQRFAAETDYRQILRQVWKRYLVAPTVEDTFGEDDIARDRKEVMLTKESMEFYKSGRLRGTNMLHCLEIIDMDAELAEYSSSVDAYGKTIAAIFKEEKKQWDRFNHAYARLSHEEKKAAATFVAAMIKEFVS